MTAEFGDVLSLLSSFICSALSRYTTIYSKWHLQIENAREGAQRTVVELEQRLHAGGDDIDQFSEAQRFPNQQRLSAA